MSQFDWVTKWQRHGLFHTWDRWQDNEGETQKRECLKCGKAQVRSVALCRHDWNLLSRIVVHQAGHEGKMPVSSEYHYRCLKCNKHKKVAMKTGSTKTVVEIV